MNFEEYKQVEKAAATWYELNKSKAKVLGISGQYYAIAFIVLFIYSGMSETDETFEFTMGVLCILIAIIIAFVTYKLYPSFVSRREKYGKSDYQFFTRRIGFTITFPLLFLWFAYSVNQKMSQENKINNLETKDVTKHSFEQKNNLSAETYKDVPSKNLDPSSSILAVVDSVVRTVELPEQTDTALVNIDTVVKTRLVEHPEDTVASQNKPIKKKWRLFRKRKNDDSE